MGRKRGGGRRELETEPVKASRIRICSQQNLRFRFVNNLSPLQLFLPINRKSFVRENSPGTALSQEQGR